MIIEGSQLVRAPREKVWRMLHDEAVLAVITPGVQELRPEGQNRFRATVKLGIGPVRGSFEGQLEITEQREPEMMALEVTGAGAPGSMSGRGVITLDAQGDDTLVRYRGEPNISGRLAAVGGRMIAGVGKKLAAQFFRELNRAAETYA